MRKRITRRKIRLSERNLKNLYTICITCCIIGLSVTVLIRVDKNGLSAVQTDISSAKNSLKDAAAVFSNQENFSEMPDISKIMEETYLGQTEYVFQSNTNPFNDAVLPANSQTVSSFFGFRNDPFTGATAFHSGVDISVDEGTDITAIYDGKVTEVSENNTGGKYIEIEHPNGYISYYGHLSSSEVQIGDDVSKGDVIAKSGNTGVTTGPHLHFELKYNDRAVDPAEFFDVYAKN